MGEGQGAPGGGVGNRFALIGAAGFVAERHLAAMVATESKLLAATDIHDSVGKLDGYFFEACFFREFERFDRYAEKLRQEGKGIEYVSICSPNYLHDAHIRFALRLGAHAICEKPLVINPWNIDPLEELARDTGGRIFPILQLRKHPSMQALERFVCENSRDIFEVELSYITARGSWYMNSWKGDDSRSGGLSSNIGIHFFDILLLIFGELESSEVHVRTATTMSGVLHLRRARVRWFLSIERENLPSSILKSNERTYRSLSIDGQNWEFSTGFADLHIQVYQDILAGRGLSPQDARPAIELTRLIRTSSIRSPRGRAHSIVRGRTHE